MARRRRATKDIRPRLEALELARELGNVAEACRRTGIDRTSFYKWQARYEAEGHDGLFDRWTNAFRHPHTTPADLDQEIANLSANNPEWGCDRISGVLAAAGHTVSGPTVQRILKSRRLATRRARADSLQGPAYINLLSPAQIAFVARWNARVRERDYRGKAPLDIIAADVIRLGAFDPFGPLYLHVAIDTWSCAWHGVIDTRRTPDAAAMALHQLLAMIWAKQPFPPRLVVTPGGPVFAGRPQHPFQAYLTGRRMRSQVLAPDRRPHGFVEQLARNLHRCLDFKYDETLDDLVRTIDRYIDVSNNGVLFAAGFPNYRTPPMQIPPIGTTAERNRQETAAYHARRELQAEFNRSGLPREEWIRRSLARLMPPDRIGHPVRRIAAAAPARRSRGAGKKPV